MVDWPRKRLREKFMILPLLMVMQGIDRKRWQPFLAGMSDTNGFFQSSCRKALLSEAAISEMEDARKGNSGTMADTAPCRQHFL